MYKNTLRYHVCQFSGKTDNFDFLGLSLPKMDLGLEIQKTNIWINNQHRRNAMCDNFQEKPTTLTLSAQICPKMGLGLGISKM